MYTFIIACQNRLDGLGYRTDGTGETSQVKMVFSFVAGIAFCSLVIFTVRMVLPVKAETGDPETASENVTNGLLNLLPDFEKIYHESLTMPFKMAESKIYDEDIAAYYRALMDKTGLVPSEEQP
jgi:hypothetical protein